MPRHAIFCKSFRDDFGFLQRLVQTWSEFASQYPMVISVPRIDRTLLLSRIDFPQNVTIVCDEDYTDADHWKAYGWVHQQLCKLSIFKLDLADSYLIVDSDSYFVAPLRDSHFEEDGRSKIVYSGLYTGFVEWNSKFSHFLQTENPDEIAQYTTEQKLPFGSIENFDRNLQEKIRLNLESPNTNLLDKGHWINLVFDIPRGIAFQPGQIFSAKHLGEFHNFLIERGLTFSTLIELSPWEYNWYACWVSAVKQENVFRSTSPILHFPSDEAINYARSIGLTPERIASRFPIVQMAARHTEAEIYSL
jgi:hypothetical protein